MRDCISSKLKLPDLNKVQIDYISDADVDLASFLTDCTPANLHLLAVNCWAYSDFGIKSKFYVDSFSKTVRRTTNEIYLSGIDFSAEDLQTVIRAVRNVERILLHYCCIHCSSGLDFGADLSYNTKFLSFQGWGSKYVKARTTDWKTDPSKFSLIVDAISSSGLRASLERLNIYSNQTLSASKVQKELNEKGMPHISVVEEHSYPLSS